MRKLYVIALLAFAGVMQSVSAQDLQLPQPSPWAQVSQKVGLTKITITYSRPSMKSRAIFGSLVPYGQIWRTGANQCTGIEFDTEVMINKQAVPAGKYAIFTIPGEKEWTIIINKDAEQSGAYNYKQDLDVMRFTVPSQNTPPVETFTIGFADVKPNTANVELLWEKTKVAFPVSVDYMKQAQENINAALEGINDAYSIYNDAAEFYIDNNLDIKQALTWAQMSVSANERYWNLFTLSKAQAANGMYAEAVKTAEKSLELARTANNNGMINENIRNIEEWKKK